MKYIIGVCAPDILPDREAPFLSRNKKKRTDPEALLSGVRSIIVVGLPHAPPIYKNLSTLGTNADYHTSIRVLLKKIAGALPPHRYKILVDSPFLDERALAVRAGLGFYGKNGLVIASFGSFFNIGCMLTDLELEPTPPTESIKCPDDCRLCLDACPVSLDKKNCISYFTQKDGAFGEGELEKLNGQLYGCDLCQVICPFNKMNPLQNSFNPDEWLNATDAELETAYKHTAMWWKGPVVMRRNAASDSL
jgi:epoxyqueuosine reductase